MKARDEALLMWFFTRGEVAFERSTHGAMIERLVNDSMTSVRCSVCEGVGILESQTAVNRSKLRGARFERRRTYIMKQHDGILTDELTTQTVAVCVGSECGICHGTGRTSRVRRKPRCVCLPGSERRHCELCHGTGRPEVTARPIVRTHETSQAREPDDDVLQRYAACIRRLSGMPRRHVLLLRAYYGPVGASWAGESEGRIHAVLQYTKAGKLLLMSRDDDTGCPEDVWLSLQLVLEHRQPNGKRGRLLQKAREQATRMLRETQNAYAGVETVMCADVMERLEQNTRQITEWFRAHRELDLLMQEDI